MFPSNVAVGPMLEYRARVSGSLSAHRDLSGESFSDTDEPEMFPEAVEDIDLFAVNVAMYLSSSVEEMLNSMSMPPS